MHETLGNAYRQFSARMQEKNRLPEALDAAICAERVAPGPRSALQAGLVYARLGRFTEAIVRFEKVVAAEADNIVAWTCLGECRLGLLQYDAGLTALLQAIALDKPATHPHGRRARALIVRTSKQLNGARS